METVLPTQPFYFLQHGGEMGSLTRNHDWSHTSIGTPDTWPQSLRTTVGNLLRSRFPMFLWWGPELIQFYNDAYRPSLGTEGKHPMALGQRGEDCWPEIWPVIYPLMQQVLQTGEPTWMENQLIPIYRNGGLENVYWTFSYSLVLNDNDAPGGVLVTCMETTESVKGRMQLQESEARFRNAMEQAPVAIGLTRGASFVFENINPPMLKLIGNKKAVDVIGKKVTEVLPELQGQGVHDILQQVIKTGVPFHGTEVMVELDRGGGLQPGYFNLSYTRLSDSSDTAFLLHMAIDVTYQVLARRKQEQSEAKLRSILNSAPTAMSVFVGPDLIVENANQLMIEVMAAGPDIEGKSFRQLLTGLVEEDQMFLRIIDGVRATGQPFEAQEVEVFFNAENATRYFNISFLPLLDEAGAIYAVLDVSVDVTEQVAARKKVEESETFNRTVLENSPDCVKIIDAEGRLQFMNTNGLCTMEIDDFGAFKNRFWKDLWGEENRQLVNDSIATALTGETAQFKAFCPTAKGTPKWWDVMVSPVKLPGSNEITSIVSVSRDITEQIHAQRKIEESEARFRTLIEEAPVATCVFTGPKMVVELANRPMLAYWGKGDSPLGKPLADALPELEGQPFLKILDEVFATGETFETKGAPAQLIVNGVMGTYYFDYTYKPLRNVAGEVYAIMNMAIDVTGQVASRKNLEESEGRFRRLADESPIFVFIIDADPFAPVSYWNKNWLDYTGQTAEEAFGRAWNDIIHPDDNPIVMKHYSPAFEGREPYFIPAVRVKRHDGVYRWHSFKGTPRYLPNGEFSGYVGVGFDIHEQKIAEEDLEELVVERTAELQTANKELQRSNSNLEEFAHAASHDLKEPIRKITFFTHQLKDQLQAHLQEAELRSFNRIENATERMGNLIDDLLLYSHVSQRPHEMEKIDLNVKVQRVLEDLELDVEEKKAVITIKKLPVVQGYRRQLQQLFQNLISNALKYSKEDVPPHIEISAGEVEENGKRYNVISVKDDGIGFNQEYAEKIFQMFTRLHGRNEYSGTGVGLSIVKKVVENHNGLIRAKSVVGEGSAFTIYLPI